MIARIRHGAVAPGKSDEYLDLLNRTGVADYRATKGNRGVYVLRRVEGGEAQPIEKIEDSAGPEPEMAKYYPEDGEFLLDFEPKVGRYEVVVES